MASIDKIGEYNEGTLWPFNYDETYIATKHIQAFPLVLVDDLVNKLEAAVASAGLYFDDEDLLKEIATGLIKGNVILQGPPGTGKTTGRIPVRRGSADVRHRPQPDGKSETFNV